MYVPKNKPNKWKVANSIDLPVAERDSLLVTVNRLQQSLQEQCNLRGNYNNPLDTVFKWSKKKSWIYKILEKKDDYLYLGCIIINNLKHLCHSNLLWIQWNYRWNSLSGVSLCDYSETVDVVVENERLKKDMADLKQQNERAAEVRDEAGVETDRI